MAEGPHEKVWTQRRGKAPLLGVGKEAGWATIGKSWHQSVHFSPGLEGKAGWLSRG